MTAGGRAGKIRVDWRNVVRNPECVDSFDIWVWVEGQTKAQGKKVSLVGHQVRLGSYLFIYQARGV